MTFSNHPNLSNDINSRLAKMDIDGGVWLSMPEEEAKIAYKDAKEKGNVLSIGKIILVQTQNTLYRIEKRGENDFWISGHPKLCPYPIQANIHGSTWGGSMLRLHWIGRDMNLEWSKPGSGQYYTTTTIQEISEE